MKGLDYAHKISEWKTVAIANFVIKAILQNILLNIHYLR